MENFAIYILLLVAIGAGWTIGRVSKAAKKTGAGKGDIYQDYFVGLNFLLNDEPDEAIDTFIKALEINSETIDTHLALGALLRRRGKVDKAIQVHQALLARPSLNQSVIDATRIQLARDYITSGLLDRAERLLHEILSEDSSAQWEALTLLITIYQTEKEWEKAIDCSRRLLKNVEYKKNAETRAAAAHYCCELAENMIQREQFRTAREHIRRAFGFDRKSIRASFILASIEQQLENYKAAIKELDRIRVNSPVFVSQVLGPLMQCYGQLGNLPEYEKLLTNSLSHDPDISVALSLCDLIKKREGNDSAISFLNEYMNRSPSLAVLMELLTLQIPPSDEKMSGNLKLVKQIVDRLLLKSSAYQCDHCGYESKSLYWLCPSCKKWDRVKPIIEFESAAS
ncbi:MAG: lipopolysaccharide biosynthesis regulator YciM [Pseudohongiellaceae bacterium]|jgi:lipopolysaccharide biosynthesis regulator YciM